MPYSPQANGEVERQNKTLLKAIRVAHSEGKNWKKELDKFLVAYRSTPQSVTGKSPFEIMYGRKMKNKLASLNKELDECVDVIRERNMIRKEKEKSYFDCKNNTKVMDVEKDDIVMLKQNKENKLSTRFASSPY